MEARPVLSAVAESLMSLQAKIAVTDARSQHAHDRRRLEAANDDPGVGPIVTSALVVLVRRASTFRPDRG